MIKGMKVVSYLAKRDVTLTGEEEVVVSFVLHYLKMNRTNKIVNEIIYLFAFHSALVLMLFTLALGVFLLKFFCIK